MAKTVQTVPEPAAAYSPIQNKVPHPVRDFIIEWSINILILLFGTTTLVQAFIDQPIDRPTLVGMLRDTAMSEANVQVMADAIIYKSIQNVRQSYLSAAIAAAGKGVMSIDELNGILADFNYSPLAQQYVVSHVQILLREMLASEAKSEVVPMVASGAMTSDQGLQQLEAAGIQPQQAQLYITLAETKAAVTLAKKEAAAEAKALLQEQRNATRTAVAEFQRGVINEAGLTAALLAIGLDPALVTSIVAVQDATRTGRMKLLWGQLLLPADAKVLSERVAAVLEQLKKQFLTVDQALAQLKQLGVDDQDANALVAKAAALIGKPTATGVFVSPITGQ